jgi:hypothetical protein
MGVFLLLDLIARLPNFDLVGAIMVSLLATWGIATAVERHCPCLPCQVRRMQHDASIERLKRRRESAREASI